MVFTVSGRRKTAAVKDWKRKSDNRQEDIQKSGMKQSRCETDAWSSIEQRLRFYALNRESDAFIL